MEKMLRKRIITAILCLACVAFSGCGNAANSGQSENAQSSVTEKSQVEPSKEVSETTESIDEDSKVESASKPDTENSKAESSKTDTSKAESSKQQENSKTSDVSKTGQTSQTSKPAESSKPSQTSQSSKHDETSKPSSQTSKPAEQSKPAETSKPSQTSTPSQPSKPTVVNVSSISLNKSSLTLTVGESSRLIATINPSNATDKGFSWINSNTSVVSIDGNGNVKALKAGTATITAKSNNGKTASCNITVKAKETSQPAKKKATSFVMNSGIWVDSNETRVSITAGIAPNDADISDIKVVFTENPNNLVSLDKIENLMDFSGHVRLWFNVKSRTKDYIAKAVVSCGSFSQDVTFRICSEYDSNLKAYYPPYDIDQIVKDMREYGESLGMEWYEPFYVKWYDNNSWYDTNAAFFFPVTAETNNGKSGGINLKDALLSSIRTPHEELGGSYTSMYFKVVPILNERENEWEFYVLYG